MSDGKARVKQLGITEEEFCSHPWWKNLERHHDFLSVIWAATLLDKHLKSLTYRSRGYEIIYNARFYLAEQAVAMVGNDIVKNGATDEHGNRRTRARDESVVRSVGKPRPAPGQRRR